MVTRHEEQKFLPYSADELFELVADIESYPQFLPWCAVARIRSREKMDEQTLLTADLVISFAAFREKFGSKVLLRPEDKSIDVDYLDGPFRRLKNHWKFTTQNQGTLVDFYVEFEFKSRILQLAIGQVFDLAMRRIVLAFEERAKELYG